MSDKIAIISQLLSLYIFIPGLEILQCFAGIKRTEDPLCFCLVIPKLNRIILDPEIGVILLGYSDGRKTGSLAMIDYSGLAEHISKGEYYDAGHAVVNLTDSDVEHLLETYAVSL